MTSRVVFVASSAAVIRPENGKGQRHPRRTTTVPGESAKITESVNPTNLVMAATTATADPLIEHLAKTGSVSPRGGALTSRIRPDETKRRGDRGG